MGFSIGFLDFGYLLDTIQQVVDNLVQNSPEETASTENLPANDLIANTGATNSEALLTEPTILSLNEITPENPNISPALNDNNPITSESLMTDAPAISPIPATSNSTASTPVSSSPPADTSEKLISTIKWYLTYDYDCDFMTDSQKIVDNSANKADKQKEARKRQKEIQRNKEAEYEKNKAENVRFHLKEDELTDFYKRNPKLK